VTVNGGVDELVGRDLAGGDQLGEADGVTAAVVVERETQAEPPCCSPCNLPGTRRQAAAPGGDRRSDIVTP
jgi:hypothetical protein